MFLILSAVLAGLAGPQAGAPEVRPHPPARCAADESRESLLCRALAAQADGRFADSAAAFEAARRSLADADPQRVRMALAAGNMWIAAGVADKAAAILDVALASGLPAGIERGEALVDRARAAALGGDLVAAAGFLARAEPDVANDPFYWLIAGGIAFDRQRWVEATTAVGKGLALAPDSADLHLLAGQVASARGDLVGARRHFIAARDPAPDSPAGRQAAAALGASTKDQP